jgi:hypothetical protein
VAHAYNPSPSGGRDQEDRGFKASWETLYLKIPPQKRASGVAQDVGPEFKPSTATKTKKKRKVIFWSGGVEDLQTMSQSSRF